VRNGRVAHHNGTLRSVAGRYGTLRKRYGMLQNVMEHYGALRDITGRYWSVTELLRNVTEPLRKVSVLPITNWIGHTTDIQSTRRNQTKGRHERSI